MKYIYTYDNLLCYHYVIISKDPTMNADYLNVYMYIYHLF